MPRAATSFAKATDPDQQHLEARTQCQLTTLLATLGDYQSFATLWNLLKETTAITGEPFTTSDKPTMERALYFLRKVDHRVQADATSVATTYTLAGGAPSFPKLQQELSECCPSVWTALHHLLTQGLPTVLQTLTPQTVTPEHARAQATMLTAFVTALFNLIPRDLGFKQQRCSTPGPITYTAADLQFHPLAIRLLRRLRVNPVPIEALAIEFKLPADLLADVLRRLVRGNLVTTTPYAAIKLGRPPKAPKSPEAWTLTPAGAQTLDALPPTVLPTAEPDPAVWMNIDELAQRLQEPDVTPELKAWATQVIPGTCAYNYRYYIHRETAEPYIQMRLAYQQQKQKQAALEAKQRSSTTHRNRPRAIQHKLEAQLTAPYTLHELKQYFGHQGTVQSLTRMLGKGQETAAGPVWNREQVDTWLATHTKTGAPLPDSQEPHDSGQLAKDLVRARSPKTPAAELRILSQHSHVAIRALAAKHRSTPRDALTRLSNDQEDIVTYNLRARPDLPNPLSVKLALNGITPQAAGARS